MTEDQDELTIARAEALYWKQKYEALLKTAALLAEAAGAVD